MSHKILFASALMFVLSTPAMADPTVGFGLNFSFGEGKVNTGVGVRVFSNDEQDKAAASIGVDYMFGSQSWRGSLGAAYLMNNGYIELNGGYDFGSGGFNFGVGVGGAKTTEQNTPDQNMLDQMD